MKHLLTIFLFIFFSGPVLAQSEIGPEGHKLVWFVLILLGAGLLAIFFLKPGRNMQSFKNPFFSRKKVTVELKKDRLYYPDYLELSITNSGSINVDIDTPLLIFSGLWYSRKFKLKGTNNNHYYPLFLMKGQNHTLNIDLNRFYGFDKTLKRLPRAKILVTEVTGKRLGSQRVLLRKTLFNI